VLIDIRCHGNLSFGLCLSDTSLSITLSQDLPTSVINIARVDLRRNSENRPSRDLKDPFHKRVEMKLRALSDRMDADRTAASTRSASYQPPERAMTSSRSAYQDRLAMSSRSSVCQNTSRALAPSKLAAQASHKYLKGVRVQMPNPMEFTLIKDQVLLLLLLETVLQLGSRLQRSWWCPVHLKLVQKLPGLLR